MVACRSHARPRRPILSYADSLTELYMFTGLCQKIAQLKGHKQCWAWFKSMIY